MYTISYIYLQGIRDAYQDVGSMLFYSLSRHAVFTEYITYEGRLNVA